MEGSAVRLRVDQAEGMLEPQEAEAEAATMGFSYGYENNRGSAPVEELVGTTVVPQGPAAQWRLVRDLHA
jgi:hypothetical protein